MVNKAYIIDHCPAIREIAGLSAERTGWRIGSKGVSMDANIVLRLLRKAGP